MINLNGKIVPLSEANVSVFDRSFLYGDSLYEVVRTYNGVPFKMKEHLDRLEASGRLCQMEFSQSLQEFEREMLRTIDAFRQERGNEMEDVYCRIVVSRGTGKIGFGLKNLETPTQYVIYVDHVHKYSPSSFEKGISLQISDRVRNAPNALPPAMKSGNYLNCLLAFLSAQKEGFDDAVMVDQDGFLTEGTTFNLFYVKRGIVVSPPFDVGMLDGITRREVMRLCIENHIPVREVRFKPEYLYDADEVFITGSVKEILPVNRVDQVKFGKPGPVTRKLREIWDEYTAASSKQ